MFALRCSHTNIESYACRLLVRTLSGVLHTSSVVRPIYWNLASAICQQQSLYAQWPAKSKDIRKLAC